MIKELWNSRTEIRTVRGTESIRKFACTWEEYSNGYGKDEDNELVYLPDIQEPYPENEKLYCVEVSTTATDNTNCVVECKYTDTIDGLKSFRANQLSSWDISITALNNIESTTSWIDFTKSPIEVVNWENFWLTSGPENSTYETTPELQIHRPSIVYKITAYGEYADMLKCLYYVGKVNSDKFLFFTSNKLVKTIKYSLTKSGTWTSKVSMDKPIDVDDIGLWLLESIDYDRQNNLTWKMTFTFLFSPNWKWNNPYGVTDSTNIYQTANFSELFIDLDNMDPLESKSGQR